VGHRMTDGRTNILEGAFSKIWLSYTKVKADHWTYNRKSLLPISPFLAAFCLAFGTFSLWVSLTLDLHVFLFLIPWVLC
jgi:hypothetical protein